MNIIATTYSGGYDLFNGCPDLLNAKIVDVKYGLSEKEYRTRLTIIDKQGLEHIITICQEVI